MPDEPFDKGQMANAIAEAIANMREIFAPMDEAALGYRAQLEAAGWSPTISEQMASQFYTLLISQFLQAMSGAQK